MFTRPRIAHRISTASILPRASHQQLQYLLLLARKRGYDLPTLNRYIRHHYGKTSPYALDVHQARLLIQKLRS